MTGLQEEAKPATSWGEQPPSERPVRLDPTDPFDNVSFEDGKNYRAFVKSLISRVEGKLATKLDDDVQDEIAKAIQLLVSMRRKVVAANRVYFELLFDILGAEQPNLLLSKSIRYRDIVHQRQEILWNFAFGQLSLWRYASQCGSFCIDYRNCSGILLPLAND